MSLVDKESLRQLIINIKNTFIENGDNVVIGKSTNKAEDFIYPESTNEEIIEAWDSNKFALAKGLGNISIGYDNLSLGEKGSFVAGISSITEGNCSFVAGENIREKGDHNAVFNANNRVEARFSSVFGRRNKVGGNTYQGFVIGYENELNMDGSTSNNTFVGGADCRVSKAYDGFVYGNNLKLTRETWGAAVFGNYNNDTSTAGFVIGNGRDDANRSNAFEVYGNGLVKTPNAPDPTDPYHLTTKIYVDKSVASLIESAPETLNTLNELAAALGNDPNFATTVLTELGNRVKFTDWASATEGKGGVVRVSDLYYGLEMVAAGPQLGAIRIKNATKSKINGRASYAYEALTLDGIDYAVKEALTDNKLVDTSDAWTSEEKTAVRTLLDVVGNTDYASAQKAGIISTSSSFGLNANAATGMLNVYAATKDDIDAKTHWFRPIVPVWLDYAVKKALADCKLANTENAWTDNEKTSARELLGAVGSTDYATNDAAGIVRGNSAGGVTTNAGGVLALIPANENMINIRKSSMVICPTNLDYAVKSGVTTNTIALTEEEKTAARSWFGAISNTDYANANDGGVVKVVAQNGVEMSASGKLYLLMANNTEIDAKASEYKPIVPRNLDYAVMKALTNPQKHTWTDEEKALARIALGTVGTTDYMTNSQAGLARADKAYGTIANANGIFSCDNKSYSEYQNGSTAMFISKGTLENIITGKGLISNINYATDTLGGAVKVHNANGLYMQSSGDIAIYRARDNDVISRTTDAGKYRPICPANLDLAVKVGVTDNTIALTDTEKTSAQKWLGVSKPTITLTSMKAKTNDNFPVNLNADKTYNIRLQFEDNNVNFVTKYFNSIGFVADSYLQQMSSITLNCDTFNLYINLNMIWDSIDDGASVDGPSVKDGWVWITDTTPSNTTDSSNMSKYIITITEA